MRSNFFGVLIVFGLTIIFFGVVLNVSVCGQINANRQQNFDISDTNFKNYSFPAFKEGTNIVLKNGKAGSRTESSRYTLRKVYFFDIDGDGEDEAIAHIIADGCELGCSSSSLFYIYKAESGRVKLLWKFAVGGDILGGLKAVTFKDKQIILETFGNCVFENLITRPEIDMRVNPKVKTADYTRFVFALEDHNYQLKDRTVLPWTRKSMAGYKSQIIFNKES